MMFTKLMIWYWQLFETLSSLYFGEAKCKDECWNVYRSLRKTSQEVNEDDWLFNLYAGWCPLSQSKNRHEVACWSQCLCLGLGRSELWFQSYREPSSRKSLLTWVPVEIWLSFKWRLQELGKFWQETLRPWLLWPTPWPTDVRPWLLQMGCKKYQIT